MNIETTNYNDGCIFCKNFDFSSVSATVISGIPRIELTICNSKFPKEKQFKYCPECGRYLN